MTPVSPAVADDEIVLRHIPGGPFWQAPPDGRITSHNFRLRPHELGYSVSRAALTTPDQLMARLGDSSKGSRIAAAKVSDLRALGFDVVPVPLADDPGHAEVRPISVDPSRKAVMRSLANAFRYL